MILEISLTAGIKKLLQMYQSSSQVPTLFSTTFLKILMAVTMSSMARPTLAQIILSSLFSLPDFGPAAISPRSA